LDHEIQKAGRPESQMARRKAITGAARWRIEATTRDEEWPIEEKRRYKLHISPSPLRSLR